MKAWNDEICHHTTSTPHKWKWYSMFPMDTECYKSMIWLQKFWARKVLWKFRSTAYSTKGQSCQYGWENGTSSPLFIWTYISKLLRIQAYLHIIVGCGPEMMAKKVMDYDKCTCMCARPFNESCIIFSLPCFCTSTYIANVTYLSFSRHGWTEIQKENAKLSGMVLVQQWVRDPHVG